MITTIPDVPVPVPVLAVLHAGEHVVTAGEVEQLGSRDA